MRFCLFFLVLLVSPGYGQPEKGSSDLLQRGYERLQNKEYEEAVKLFQEVLTATPQRSTVRKDLAYTYLKIGENEKARDQFGEVMRLNPSDLQAALEYAFLCHETGERVRARRVFDRVRKQGEGEAKATAESAFQNIDGPLAEGIARWSKVAEATPQDFMAHLELARLAEDRDELEVAGKHYEAAWRLKPAERQLLVSLARVWRSLNLTDRATAALLAASRGSSARASEAARDLLPVRYPYVYEFRLGLELDPANVELRRELAYLLLSMDKQTEAEKEFRALLERTPEDLLASAQLGLMLLARNDRARAMPLLDSVMKGPDSVLANRVRATLKLPVERKAEEPAAGSSDAKVLAQRSLEKGYLQDAVRYLKAAHETDREDPWVMLKLGWTYNVLREDREAIQWFEMARRSGDPLISAEAKKAYENLRSEFARFRTTVWTLPMYSSRWNDAFTYSQVKTEIRIRSVPFRPYLSIRVNGDVRQTTGGPLPQFLSENAAILAAGVATRTWNGVTLWGEAGSALSFGKAQPGVGKLSPDYRGGLSFVRGFGHAIGSRGWFYDLSADGVYVSRFDDDILLYLQNRLGWTLPPANFLGGVEAQLYIAGNLVTDTKRAAWANFGEAGPGLRFRWPFLPKGTTLFVEYLRGGYGIPQDGVRKANYFDLRGGVWYAISR
ncbi:MAG: tetratricopeptide repeat protein [Bryobacteraceae bacterium]